MNLRERFTLIGILSRLLVTLRQLVRAQERLARTQELSLKLELLRGGNTLQELEGASFDPGGQAEVATQTPEELLLIKQIQADAERRGIRLNEEDDPIEIFKELGYIPRKAPQEEG